MSRRKAKENLDLARGHLIRVQESGWGSTPDWVVLSTFGFYCLEAAVVAAANHFNWPIRRSHPDKAQAAQRLSREKSFPDIYDLLLDLNSARKSTAYGDLPFPSLDAEDVVGKIEQYVDEVAVLIEE